MDGTEIHARDLRRAEHEAEQDRRVSPYRQKLVAGGGGSEMPWIRKVYAGLFEGGGDVVTKQIFTIHIVYFKPNGKFYTDTTVDHAFRATDTNGCYMADVSAWIRGLRDCGGPGAMPGLCGDGWDGPIFLDCDKGFPVLVLQ